MRWVCQDFFQLSKSLWTCKLTSNIILLFHVEITRLAYSIFFSLAFWPLIKVLNNLFQIKTLLRNFHIWNKFKPKKPSILYRGNSKTFCAKQVKKWPNISYLIFFFQKLLQIKIWWSICIRNIDQSVITKSLKFTSVFI